MATEFTAEQKSCNCSYSCDCEPHRLTITFEEDGFVISVDRKTVQLTIKESDQLARLMDLNKEFLSPHWR